jgi:hypothetical protein
MAVVKTVALSGTPAAVIPPDGVEHTGPMLWTLIIPSGTTLSDDAAGDNEVAIAAGTYQFLIGNDQLFAKGSGSVLVVGLNGPTGD